jgi:hypothetical protein
MRQSSNFMFLPLPPRIPSAVMDSSDFIFSSRIVFRCIGSAGGTDMMCPGAISVLFVKLVSRVTFNSFSELGGIIAPIFY